MTKRTPLQFTQTKTVTPSVSATNQALAPVVRAEPTVNIRTRQGLKFIGGYFAGEAKKQFQIICIHEGLTEEKLLAEALNDLFAKRGLSRLA